MTRAVAAAALLIMLAPPARAQNVAEYLALARAYAAGDGVDAEHRLASWSRDEVVAAGKAVSATATIRDLIAAAMLHTDLANTVIDRQGDTADFHITRAEWLLAIARGDSPQTERLDNTRARTFSSRWFRFVAGMYTSCNRLADAARYVSLGLLAFPEDPRLSVARGIMVEVRTLTFIPETQKLNALRGRRDEEVEESLTLAATHFLHATSIDAHNAEARLHLGRVRFLMKDTRAKADLEAALANASDDTVRYLARLMLGGLAEREHRLVDALRDYDAARAAGPGYQTAYVALSRVEEALGQTERAREHAAVALQLKKGDDDPWWDQRIGFDRESLRWLRAEARRP